MKHKKVLFVCLGNICRSPLAEAMFRVYAKQQPNGAEIEVDSAGTGDWHIGEKPDSRSITEGARRGIELNSRARKVVPSDFNQFDLLVAMDGSVANDLQHWPGSVPRKVVLMRSFDPAADCEDVPDPYAGGPGGFVVVGDMIEAAIPGLYQVLTQDVTSEKQFGT